MSNLKTDVIIIGCGPTGVILAHLLGKLGVSVRIIEKEEKIFPVPRATHIDEETLRNFQATGLMPQLEKFTSTFGTMEVYDANGKRLFQEEVIQPDSIHGYIGSRFFDQPEFENILREGLKKYKTVELLKGIEVTTISQSTNEVSVTGKNNGTNEIFEFVTSWVIGCDGGRSVTRAALNVEMDALEPARDWIIVDTILKEEAFATLLPDRFQYLFLPERLTIYAHGFGKHRRWEFQLNKDEKAPSDETVKKWVSKFVSLQKVEITRIAKYAHNSLVARKWRKGKVLLAGDAAHMMPPSAGQGLCSGVRDALNLSWKLSAVIKKEASEKILDTYEAERKAHLNEILKRTLFIGHRMDGDNSLQKFWRKFSLQIIEQIQPLKNYLRKTYNTPPPLKGGCLNLSSSLAGHHIPQTIIADGNLFSDDIVGYNFALITFPRKLSENQISTAKEKSIFILHEHVDIKQTLLSKWLDKHNSDFVIVRPDKIIFGNGKANEYENVMSEFEKWF